MEQKIFTIIGAGAAGIFAAVNAAKINPNLQVIVLEKSNQLLSKVRISGGGRCNLTHAHTSISAMAACYPRGESFVKKTFTQFFTSDTIEWFGSRGVPTKTEADGRMFPASNTSQSIIDCLLKEADKYNVQIKMQSGVVEIIPPLQINGKYSLRMQNENILQSDFVLVACGGFNKPEHFTWLQKLGHTFSNPVPSLFTFNASKKWMSQFETPIISLMGVVAQNAIVKIKNSKLQSKGPVLITHWGLSGPAILTLSAFAARHLEELNYQYEVFINWCSSYNETSILEFIRTNRNVWGSQLVHNKNKLEVPNRLWEYLCNCSNIAANVGWNQLSAIQQNALAKNLCSFVMLAEGKTTYKEEFVTAGGITLAEVNTNTCESKLQNNLFFAGEILDVDGKTGGFNFQHAWSSGFVVAKCVAERAHSITK
jgi:predicted Rossmann fold flavoprotein